MSRNRKPLTRTAPTVPNEADPDVEHMRNCLAEIRRWTIEGTHPRTPHGAEDEAERLRTVLREIQRWAIQGRIRGPKVDAS